MGTTIHKYQVTNTGWPGEPPPRSVTREPKVSSAHFSGPHCVSREATDYVKQAIHLGLMKPEENIYT